jgi:hypothetical protein
MKAPVKRLNIKTCSSLFARFFLHVQNSDLAYFVSHSLTRPSAVTLKGANVNPLNGTKHIACGSARAMTHATQQGKTAPQNFARSFVRVLRCVVHHELNRLFDAPAPRVNACRENGRYCM